MNERTFDAELGFLKEKVLKMGCLASGAIFDSVEALKARDEALSLKVIDGDSHIDAMELEINDNCIG